MSPIQKVRIMRPALLLFLFLSILFYPLNDSYSQYKNIPIKIQQPDGKKLKVFVSGGQLNNWIHDSNGYTIIQDETSGEYRYAVKINDKIVASEYKAGEDKILTANLTPNLIPKYSPVAENSNRLLKSGQSDKIVLAPKSGQLNNIVIFIRFADEQEFTTPLSYYDNIFNSTTDTAHSLKNYYLKCSYNQLSINSYMFPTATSSILSYQDVNPRGYFQPFNQTTNPIGYKTFDDVILREHSLLKRAVESVASQISPTINLDMNNDGYVDNICFVVQGYPDGWSQLLWPHKWDLFSQDVKIGTTRVMTYNLQLEEFIKWYGSGVLCHEMFHSLGAPDLYHYNMDLLDPVGEWDLMAMTTNPAQQMGAYMKYKYGGWINDIPEIKNNGVYTLHPLSSSQNNVYKIKSPTSQDEYFIIEYRKKDELFEKGIPSDGLLVYRINSKGLGDAEALNDELYIYRPNGTLISNGSVNYAGFASDFQRTQINDITNPSSFLSDGKVGGLNISEVSSTSETISFKVDFPSNQKIVKILAPNAFEPLKANHSYDIKWSSYNVDKITILFSSDYTVHWDTLVSNYQASLSKYTWTVPAINSDGCRLKIMNSDESAVDISNSDFVIVTEDNSEKVIWEKFGNELTSGYIESMAVQANGDMFVSTFNTVNHLYHYHQHDNSWNEFTIEPIWAFSPRVQKWLVLPNGTILAGSNWFLSASNDNGATWNLIHSFLVGYGEFATERFIYDLKIDCNGKVLTVVDRSIYRCDSEQPGDNWTKLAELQTPENQNGQIQHLEISGQNIFASTWGGGIYRSTDNGNTWKAVNNGMSAFTYLTKILSSGRVLAGTIDGLYISDDNGDTWKKYNDTELTTAKIISFIETDDGLLFAGSYGCHGPGEGIYVSRNFGNSWIKMNEGLTETSTRTLVLTPDSYVYIGIGYGDGSKNGGIFRTDLNASKIDWEGSISISDKMGNITKQTLKFGQSTIATDGIDNKLREYAISSSMQICQLEARFNLQSPNVQVYEDYKNSSSLSPKWQLQYEPSSTGFPLELTWNINKTLPGTLRLKVATNNYVDMQKTNTYQITSSSTKNLVVEYSTGTVSVDDNTGMNNIPHEYALYQNYPNPFNPSTTIKYQLPFAGHVSIKIFDILGREVTSLVDEYKQPGYYSSEFSSSSLQLSSGIYFYRIQANEFTAVKKLLLIK